MSRARAAGRVSLSTDSMQRWRLQRAALVRVGWGDALPTTEPAVEIGYAGESAQWSFGAQTARTDRLVCTLPRGGSAVAHLYHPTAEARGETAVLWSGHGHSPAGPGGRMSSIYLALISAGYHVLGMSMPSYGYNPATLTLSLTGGGTTTLTYDHNASGIEADGVSGLRYFVEPVIQCLNYTTRVIGPCGLGTGLSGGAQSVEMAAAVDTRIRRSYPVMGSLPPKLRYPRGPGVPSDWENDDQETQPIGVLLGQRRAWWGALVSYEELAALGCVDDGRRRMQILGTNDAVFNVSHVLTEIGDLEARINALVPAGQHAIEIDTTTDPDPEVNSGHEYSDETIAAILADAA